MHENWNPLCLSIIRTVCNDGDENTEKKLTNSQLLAQPSDRSTKSWAGPLALGRRDFGSGFANLLEVLTRFLVFLCRFISGLLISILSKIFIRFPKKSFAFYFFWKFHEVFVFEKILNSMIHTFKNILVLENYLNILINVCKFKKIFMHSKCFLIFLKKITF